MFNVCAGKSRHLPEVSPSLPPSPGHDSHTSANHLVRLFLARRFTSELTEQEWFLFDASMCCPTYVLRVRAIENTRTAADDEKEDNVPEFHEALG